ncbi:GerMN domain-containing protein [Ruminococcus sp. 5_1_39BFAA]|uniref:GerMN domain-containing protein n=1 Tax=Ruminococcus sp. 5_1_39BFAA TaxID=457412 RepID=UPI0035692570
MKRILGILLSAVMAFGLLAGCSVEVQEEKSDSGSNQYYLYYINKEETNLEKESYVPERETAEFMLQDLTAVLNGHQQQGEKLALLPKEVELNSSQMNGSVLELSFNNQYSNISRTREILVRAGIVKMFLQVPGITGVKFFVGNNELLDSKAQPVGEMNEDTFAELWGTEREAYRYGTFTLYFTDSTGEKLVEEKRNVYYKRSLPRERVILEQLAKGPMVKGNYPTIPESTEVMDITTADDVCYVDFNSAFQDYQLDIPVNTVIYSVVNSLLTAANADKVQISIGGNDEAVLNDGTSLYNFYERSEELVAAVEMQEKK